MGIKDNVIDSMARYWFISNDNLLLLQGRFSGCSAWGWLCGTWSQSLRWFCKWADFGMSMLKKLLRALAAFDSESVIPAVGSVSPWSLWHEVPCRCVMDSKLSVLMLQAGELLWASVSNIAMRGDGGPWVVESVPGRVWWQIDQIGQSLPLFKIWCRVMQVEQPWYQVHSTTRTVDLTSIQESWTLQSLQRSSSSSSCLVPKLPKDDKNLKWHQQGVGTC